MDKARIGGAIICILVIVIAAAFVWGLTLPAWRFWTVAIPVAIGFLAVLALVFWIGWTMTTTKVELPPPPEDTGDDNKS